MSASFKARTCSRTPKSHRRLPVPSIDDLSTENPTPKSGVSGGIFATTHWTVVLAAGRTDSKQADVALEELYRTYWYPLYAYVRRHGHSREDAEDLTQGFFARLLEKNYLEGVSSEKGKFRAFLLMALKRFMANEWDRANTQKRGGGMAPLSLDWQDAESRYQINPAHDLSPDKLYDQAWAVIVLERVITQDFKIPPTIDFAPEGLTYALDLSLTAIAASEAQSDHHLFWPEPQVA